jgi:integrase
MAKPPEAAPVFKPGPDIQVVEILDAFLDWCQKHRSPRTYNWYRDFYRHLAATLPPALKVTELKSHHLTKAMDAKPEWSNNTRNDFVTAVKRAFNWALDEELIDRNPVGRAKKPAREARELAIGPEDFAEVMAAAPELCFRTLLDFAWETGVRPQEIIKIEAWHVMPELNRVVLPPKEAKGKKRHRIIYLTDAGLAMLQPLMERRGPLFRNSDGQPWNKNSINCAFCRLRLRLAERMMERDGCPRPKVAKVPRKQLSQARAERRAALVRWWK